MPAVPQSLLDDHVVFRALLPLAFIIMTAGLIGAMARSTSVGDRLDSIVHAIVILAVLSQFDAILDHAQNYVQHLVTAELKVHPEHIHAKFLERITQSRNDKAKKSLWARLMSPSVTMVEAVVAGLLWLASLVAACVLFLAYLGQKIFLQSGYALAPLFFSFLFVGSLRPIAVHYLLSMAGVVLWPLGWAICSIVTDRLLDSATDQSFFIANAPSGGLWYALRNLVSGFLISVWIIISTPVAPIVIQKFITTGAQIGGGSWATIIRVLRR